MEEVLINKRVKSSPEYSFESFLIIKNGESLKTIFQISAKEVLQTDLSSQPSQHTPLPLQATSPPNCDIAMFCFPYAKNLKFSSSLSFSESEIFTFALTDSQGWQQFGFCLHVKKYNSLKDSHISDFHPRNGNSFSHFQRTHIPEIYCLCFLSYLPWFSFFSDCLSAIASFLFSPPMPKFSSNSQIQNLFTSSAETSEFIITPSLKILLLNFLKNIYFVQAKLSPGQFLHFSLANNLSFSFPIPVDSASQLSSIPESFNLTTLFCSLS
eukprot:Sdes_comp17758_c0_seq1m7026